MKNNQESKQVSHLLFENLAFIHQECRTGLKFIICSLSFLIYSG